MLYNRKLARNATIIATTVVCLGGTVHAKEYKSHQNFNAHTKKCVDLGFLGHACTPDVHISGTVYEEAEFSPKPQAKVRLKVDSPISFDTGFQGADSTGCMPVPGVSYFGEGVSYCTDVKNVHYSGDQIKFDIKQSLKLSIGIPNVKTWGVEVPLWHKNVDIKN